MAEPVAESESAPEPGRELQPEHALSPATAMRFQVLVLNQISAVGLKRFPAAQYHVGADIDRPDAVLVRSVDLHARAIPASVQAVARAGAGTNNVPVAALSARGVPVFNAPGGNANAVKELVLAAMLLTARNLAPALRFVARLHLGLNADATPRAATAAALDNAVENGKQAFAGFELAGRTLGVIGLGKVGCLVADAAIKLGMEVHGFDPHITVDAAWSLPAQVKKAASVAEVLKHADFVSLHVPLVDATHDLIHAGNLGLLRASAVLLNFARDGVVNEAAVLGALDARRLSWYACDFPSPALIGHERVIALPHLGASTAQAKENCAVMVVDQLRDYLEHGNVSNAVNFPALVMARESAFRVAIANANVPNMLGQISTAMAGAGLNVRTMVNKSRGDMAYTLVDVDSAVDAAVLDKIRAIAGVLSVRYLPDGEAAC